MNKNPEIPEESLPYITRTFKIQANLPLDCVVISLLSLVMQEYADCSPKDTNAIAEWFYAKYKNQTGIPLKFGK